MSERDQRRAEPWPFRGVFHSIILAVLSLGLSGLPRTANGQASDQAAFNSLVRSFFLAYQKKDLAATMALWDENAADAWVSKRSFKKRFSKDPDVQIKVKRIEPPETVGDSVKVIAFLEWRRTDGKAEASSSDVERIFYLVNRGGAWKVIRYTTVEEELASRVGSAKTELERKQLLDANNQLINCDFDSALEQEARRLIGDRQYLRAIPVYEVKLAVATQLDNQSGVAAALVGIGEAYLSAVIYDKARVYLDKGLNAYPDSDSSGKARALMGIGQVLRGQGKLAEARGYLVESVKKAEEAKDEEETERTVFSLARLEDEEGNYLDGLAHYRRALEIAEELGDEYLIGWCGNNIAIIYGKRGNYQSALEYFENSRKAAEVRRDDLLTAAVSHNIGILQRKLGNYEQSLQDFRRSLDIHQKVGDQLGLAHALGGVGNAYADLHDYTQALDYLQRASTIVRAIGAKGEIAEALHDIASVERSRGCYDSAIERLEESVKLWQEVGNRYGIAETFGEMGDFYSSEGLYDKAVEVESRASAIAREIGALELQAQALTVIGNSYRALGDYDKAETAYIDTIAATEKLRSQLPGPQPGIQRFLESRIGPYHAMAEILAAQGHDSEALNYAERAKARVLLDVLESGRVDIDKWMTPDEKSEEGKLKSNLASLNGQVLREQQRNQPDEGRLTDLERELKKAEIELDGFETTLYGSHPQLKVKRAEFEPISTNECSRLLNGQGVAILEFLVSDDMTLLFSMRRSGRSAGAVELSVYKIKVTQKELADLTNRFRDRLARRDMTSGQLGLYLYDLLLKPAARDVAGKSRLIIVPDGILWDMPFQAFESQPGRFVVEDRAISYAPSLTALSAMTKDRPRRSANGGVKYLLAFGNPLVPTGSEYTDKAITAGPELRSLPQVERQVKAIGRLYGPKVSDILVGDNATEDRLKAEVSNYRVLHIAAHGIVNDSSPMYSKIVLGRAAGSDEDGVLEAWEIAQLNLNADFVVLSACETARGRVTGGEGMIGLSWAFFVAGCPTTLASQWSVDADSTTKLMVEFHRNLLRFKGMSRAEALRLAEVRLLRIDKYSDPFYWAGFVIVGKG